MDKRKILDSLETGCWYSCAISAEERLVAQFTGRWTRRHHPIFSVDGSDYAFAASDIVECVGFERPMQE